MNSFRKLNVYVKSKKLVTDVYRLMRKFPKEEQYALCDQLRRAVISIPSNLAEGSGRQSNKDQSHFYTIAYGSLMEVLAQMDIALELEYINKDDFAQLEIEIEELARMLSAMSIQRQTSSLNSKL